MKYSIRKKSTIYIIILIILAFAVGLSLCAAFASRYYTEVTRSEMCNAYNLIKQMYIEDASLPYGFSIPGEYYQKLNEICEENGFSMLIVRPSGYTVFAYGNTDILYRRLNHLVFHGKQNTQDTDSIISVLEEGDGYKIQTVRGSDANVNYVEMWGFLYDGSNFIYRCPYSGIRNNITVSLSFYLFICALVFAIFAL